MRVTVCIPTIRPDTVADAITSIRRQRYTDWELIVVAQGPQDRIRPVVDGAAEGDARVRYVHLDRRGLSIARNRAFREASGDVIAFTDDDCEAPEDWLEQLVEAYGRHPEAGLVFGALTKPPPLPSRFKVCPSFSPRELVYDPVASDRQAPPGWSAIGANYSVRADVAAQIGDFDEFLGAGAPFAAAEETDYGMRAERLGVTMYSTPQVTVHHTHGYRYGLKAVYGHRRAYARGNGALAAKLTHLGDERGRTWLNLELRGATIEPFKTFKPQLLPTRLMRLAHFATAYRTCMREYRADRGSTPDDLIRATLHRR
jgi:glycosyltransferase involved in cell wall biosynthesis